MSTFILIHGGGDVGWYWHLVEAELRARGHDVVAPDLPANDDSATLGDYADAVVRPSVTGRSDRRRSFVRRVHRAARRRSAPGRPAGLRGRHGACPGEPPKDWWANTGLGDAVREQAARDGGLTGNEDPFVSFYHDVPRPLAEQALSKERAHPSAASMAAPVAARAWPDVPTKFVLCTQDRFFPPDFLRRVVADRLHIVPDEIAASHCVALSRPKELAEILERYAAATLRGPGAARKST